MEIINSELFFKIIENFEIVPYSQRKGYFDLHSISGKGKLHFFCDCLESPTIAFFGHEKSFITKKMILIEGECYNTVNDINIKKIRSLYSDFIKLQIFDFIEIVSNAKYSFEYETGLRQAGYLRPVGQFSMPITKYIDLSTKITYNKNWNTYIKKAYQNNLRFEEVSKVELSDCEDFIRVYNEMISRKSLNCPLTVNQVYVLCISNDFKLYFVSNNNIRIAGSIIHERLTHAGLYYAATNQVALKLSASFFMYNELFNHLKNKGILTFDLEKLEPSTKPVNNIYLFKNGIDGTLTLVNGEWSWYKKNYYRPLMYFVKKYLMKKREL